MRIVDIRETAIPLKSTLANSSFDFTEMTTSVVAVITDVVRNGKPICGFAFNSTGRYACGAQMRARFIPRILAADPASLLDNTGSNLDPAKILDCMLLFLLIASFQTFSIAVIGEYVGKIYFETKARPRYIIEQEIGTGAKVEATDARGLQTALQASAKGYSRAAI